MCQGPWAAKGGFFAPQTRAPDEVKALGKQGRGPWASGVPWRLGREAALSHPGASLVRPVLQDSGSERSGPGRGEPRTALAEERNANFTDVWLKPLIKNVEFALGTPSPWDSGLCGGGKSGVAVQMGSAGGTRPGGLTALLAHCRERQTEAGGHRQRLRHVLHGGAPRAAGQQPTPAEAAARPEPQPFHGHGPHAHGDGGGHLPEAGAPPVPGDAERVSGRTLVGDKTKGTGGARGERRGGDALEPGTQASGWGCGLRPEAEDGVRRGGATGEGLGPPPQGSWLREKVQPLLPRHRDMAQAVLQIRALCRTEQPKSQGR